MIKSKKASQLDYLDEEGRHLISNITLNHKTKKHKILMFSSFIFFCLLLVGLTFLPLTHALFKNSKEVTANVAVPDNDYCINNGFTKLSDCMLVTENYAKSVSAAKSYIATKGTGDFSKMAPTITYKEKTTAVTDANGVLTTTAHFTLAKSYTFNTSTGMFILNDYTNEELTDAYINYYTCGGTTGTSASCSTLYQVKKYTKTTGTDGTVTYKITSAIRHNYSAVDALDSEIGLYSMVDDNGTSYYYRGNVKNNYVSFAGYIWRIIRENGNGTVRMIYSGKSTSAAGEAASIGITQFDSKYLDPTYVGYKYSENFTLNTTGNASVEYKNFSENRIYYYGQSYTFDNTTKRFKLTGNTISGKWKDIYTKVLSSYPYTCYSTSATGTCAVMVKNLDYINDYTANVHLLSYSSKDYNSTLLNTTDTLLKTTVDNWYAANILNKKDANSKLYSSYLSDEVFCNDRSVASGSGYLLSPTTTYGAYNRLIQKKEPTLKCKQVSDRFSVSTTKGNGSLKYPIGLITIDEAALAGGLYNAVNTQYYLYTGQTYWTLSPAYFYSPYISARGWYVNESGDLKPWYYASPSYGARPVINLSSNVLIAGGNGTASRPYTLKLA